MDFATAQKILAGAGVRFDDGMRSSEIQQVQEEFDIAFPPDLREFLTLGLPVSKSWIDWRHGDRAQIRERLAWPLDGMCFDIEHNVFWLDEWGPKPTKLAEAFDTARIAVAKAPKLIPICSHRYIPSTPPEAGNPIFSVHQTDIIYYGLDLMNYLQNEFNYYFGQQGMRLDGIPRRISFWSKLVDLNSGQV
jgi:hypothetical protein